MVRGSRFDRYKKSVGVIKKGKRVTSLNRKKCEMCGKYFRHNGKGTNYCHVCRTHRKGGN